MSRFCCAIPGPKGDTGEIFARYGSFYSLQDQHYAQNTPTAMEFEITDLSNGVSITNNALGRPTRISFDNLGVYNIQFSAQLHNNGGGGAGNTVDIWLKHNDVVEPNTNTKIVINTNGPYLVAAWNFFVNVDTLPQWFEIFWNSDNANIWIEYIAANGSIPAVPSIILTVNQVG